MPGIFIPVRVAYSDIFGINAPLTDNSFKPVSWYYKEKIGTTLLIFVNCPLIL